MGWAWFDNLFISQADRDKADQLTTDLTALTQRRADLGLMTQEEADARIKLIQGAAYQSAQDFSPSNAFVEGLKEGADNIRQAVGSTINETAAITWRMIPWQVWAILGLVVVIYLLPILLPRRA